MNRLKLFRIAYILMVLAIFLLPLVSIENYSILTHTTSQLGAQNTPNAWVMNAVFILMGSISVYSGWKVLKPFLFHRIVLLGFGVSLCLAALFRHAPIDPTLTYNVSMDEWHSVFASSTGFLFTLFAIATGFIQKRKEAILLPVLIGIMATVLSIMMFWLEEYRGIWQRLIFILSFGWMIYEFNKREKEQK